MAFRFKELFSGGRFKELMKKYGKVALGVHFSVSAASLTGLYVAIRSNVDVESIFDKLHIPGVTTKKDPEQVDSQLQDPDISGSSDRELVIEEPSGTLTVEKEKRIRNRTAELAASSGGAFALAILCNKALFPIRVPITVALTPPIARFLAKRNIIKTGV